MADWLRNTEFSRIHRLRCDESDRCPRPWTGTGQEGNTSFEALPSRGVAIAIHWVPGHAEVLGNEIADTAARGEASMQRRGGPGEGTVRGSPVEEVSAAWLKNRRTKVAAEEWRRETRSRSRGCGTFSVPGEGPRIPRPLQRTPKGIASLFFQMASAHAMIAPLRRSSVGSGQTFAGGVGRCDRLGNTCSRSASPGERR